LPLCIKDRRGNGCDYVSKTSGISGFLVLNDQMCEP
jgi:hypothetical protein